MTITRHAVDVGFGRTKGRGDKGCCNLRSVIGDFKPITFSLGATQGDRLVIGYNNKAYAVDEMALAQSTPRATIDEKRAFSEEGMVLLMAALVKMSDRKAEERINLVLGLPVAFYDQYKDKYIAAVKRVHAVDVMAMDGTVQYQKYFVVENVKVLPQPVGTVFDVLTEDGGAIRTSETSLARGNVGVVNIGYNTVELARVDNLEYKGMKSTSFMGMGMFTVFQELSNEIRNNLGVTIPPERMESFYKNGAIKKEGELISIAALKARALESASAKIISAVKSFWTDRWELDRILLAGGGSLDLNPYLSQELGKQAKIVYDPVMANANGFYKFAQRTWS